MTPHLLVAYATRRGSTRELAEAIVAVFRSAGLPADACAAADVDEIRADDVVVLGSAVYRNHWQPEAIDFLRRFESELRRRPTWLFSTGPIGGTPEAEERLARTLRLQAAPPGEAGEWAERLHVRGHHTFGGRIRDDVADPPGLELPRGDWRDPSAVAAWACSIAAALA